MDDSKKVNNEEGVEKPLFGYGWKLNEDSYIHEHKPVNMSQEFQKYVQEYAEQEFKKYIAPPTPKVVKKPKKKVKEEVVNPQIINSLSDEYELSTEASGLYKAIRKKGNLTFFLGIKGDTFENYILPPCVIQEEDKDIIKMISIKEREGKGVIFFNDDYEQFKEKVKSRYGISFTSTQKDVHYLKNKYLRMTDGENKWKIYGDNLVPIFSGSSSLINPGANLFQNSYPDLYNSLSTITQSNVKYIINALLNYQSDSTYITVVNEEKLIEMIQDFNEVFPELSLSNILPNSLVDELDYYGKNVSVGFYNDFVQILYFNNQDEEPLNLAKVYRDNTINGRPLFIEINASSNSYAIKSKKVNDDHLKLAEILYFLDEYSCEIYEGEILNKMKAAFDAYYMKEETKINPSVRGVKSVQMDGMYLRDIYPYLYGQPQIITEGVLGKAEISFYVLSQNLTSKAKPDFKAIVIKNGYSVSNKENDANLYFIDKIEDLEDKANDINNHFKMNILDICVD